MHIRTFPDFQLLSRVSLKFSYRRVNPLKPIPFVIVLASSTDQIETLQNIDDVIDSPSFNAKMLCDFVKRNQTLFFFQEKQEKFTTELLETLLFTVVKGGFLGNADVSMEDEGEWRHLLFEFLN
jgi:hypothetical protein